MALNPIAYTEKVVRSFLRYQLTAYPFADPRRPVSRCLHCGHAGEPVRLHAVRQREANPGRLTSCLSCGAVGHRLGGRYREPARPVRAINVADVHVLAQDMVHHAARRRLLVFCDNARTPRSRPAG